MMAVGVGSFAFHATLTHTAQLADELRACADPICTRRADDAHSDDLRFDSSALLVAGSRRPTFGRGAGLANGLRRRRNGHLSLRASHVIAASTSSSMYPVAEPGLSPSRLCSDSRALLSDALEPPHRSAKLWTIIRITKLLRSRLLDTPEVRLSRSFCPIGTQYVLQEDRKNTETRRTAISGIVLYVRSPWSSCRSSDEAQGAGFFIWNVDNLACVFLTRQKDRLGYPLSFLLEGHAYWHLLTGAPVSLPFRGCPLTDVHRPRVALYRCHCRYALRLSFTRRSRALPPQLHLRHAHSLRQAHTHEEVSVITSFFLHFIFRTLQVHFASASSERSVRLLVSFDLYIDLKETRLFQSVDVDVAAGRDGGERSSRLGGLRQRCRVLDDSKSELGDHDRRQSITLCLDVRRCRAEKQKVSETHRTASTVDRDDGLACSIGRPGFRRDFQPAIL